MKKFIITLVLLSVAIIGSIAYVGVIGFPGGNPNMSDTNQSEMPPSTTTPTGTTTPTSEDTVQNRSVLNPTAILSNHRDGLRSTGSFTSHSEDHRTVQFGASGNDSVEEWTTTTIQTRRTNFDQNEWLIVHPGETETETRYTDGTGTYVRIEGAQGDAMAYPSESHDDPIGLPAGVELALGSVKYEEGAERRIDGATVQTYNGTSLLTQRGLKAKNPDVEFSNVNSTIAIDGSGVIRAFTLDLRYETSGGEVVTREVTYETTGLGETSVTTPGWLEEAKGNSTDSGMNPFPNNTTNNSTA